MSGYEKCTVHYMTAGGEKWEVGLWGGDTLVIEETRKNGQEDCHISGEALLVEGRWVLHDHLVEAMGMYMYTDTAEKVQAFLDEHGAPE